MSDHEELETSVAAWVLGALEPDEEEAVRSHVEGCTTCRELAQRLRRVVGALPLVAEETAPPPNLRARVLAAATAARGEPPAVAGRPRPTPILVPAARAARAGGRMPAYAMAAVAAVALLLGVIVGQVALRQPPTPPVARYTLAGHQDLAGARGTVVDLRSEGVALVDFSGLPDPGSGRVYEVWLIPAKGNPVAAAVFVPDGSGARTVLIDRPLTGYAEIAVTNEAGPNGASAPTQQPQLYGNLA